MDCKYTIKFSLPHLFRRWFLSVPSHPPGGRDGTKFFKNPTDYFSGNCWQFYNRITLQYKPGVYLCSSTEITKHLMQIKSRRLKMCLGVPSLPTLPYVTVQAKAIWGEGPSVLAALGLSLYSVTQHDLLLLFFDSYCTSFYGCQTWSLKDSAQVEHSIIL